MPLIAVNSSGNMVLLNGSIVISSDKRTTIVDAAGITMVATWKAFAVCTPWFNWGWQRSS
jgi:hypothetical protein